MLTNIAFSDLEIGKINDALLILEETFSGKLIKDLIAKAEDPKAPLEIENASLLPGDEETLIRFSMPACSEIPAWQQDEITLEQLNPIVCRLKNIAQQVVSTNRAVLLRCWNASSKY